MASEVLSSPDLCSVVFKNLKESGLCACAAVCHAWREVALSDALWKDLADQCAEALGLCPGATAEQRSDTGRMLETLGGGSAAPGGHRALLMRRKTMLPVTLCLDFGRGYAKYGFADSPKCAQLQICSPGAEACMTSFISAAMQKLLRAESRSPGPTFSGGHFNWSKPLAADSAAAAAIVAEPFRMAAAHEDEERKRFHLAVRRDLDRWRVPRCCVVDSASLVLFAHGLTDGIVVNVGFSQTFVVPVVGGRCVRDAVVSGRVGGATLTQLMLDVLAARPELDLSRLREGALPAITVARNLKARLYLLWLHVPWLHLPWLHSLRLLFFHAYSYHGHMPTLASPIRTRYGAPSGASRRRPPHAAPAAAGPLATRHGRDATKG